MRLCVYTQPMIGNEIVHFLAYSLMLNLCRLSQILEVIDNLCIPRSQRRATYTFIIKEIVAVGLTWKGLEGEKGKEKIMHLYFNFKDFFNVSI